MSSTPSARSEDFARLHETCTRLRRELGRRIIGQSDVIDTLLISLFCRGHSLLVGVPGLAKTLLVRSLAETLGLSYNRVQFTPDLMPADITGTEVIHEDRASGERQFRFVPGPIFANIVLADEINRTPPKTQAALLEAMQEQQVTFGGVRHALPSPFFVLATENPIEHEGTYPLPEAQLDRFMLEIQVRYPTEDEELQIVQRKDATAEPLQQVINADELAHAQTVCAAIPMAEHDQRYAIALVRATRAADGPAAEVVKYLNWGAGPRASEWLVRAARAHAAVTGRDIATSSDVQAMAPAVLRHRLVTNFHARAEQLTVDELVSRLLEQVPTPAQQSGPTIFKKFMTG